MNPRRRKRFRTTPSTPIAGAGAFCSSNDTDPMAFRFRLPSLFSDLSAARSSSFWGACAVCVRTTPWHVDTLRGAYRCTSCGRTPQPVPVRAD